MTGSESNNNKALSSIPADVQKTAIDAAKYCYSETFLGQISQTIDNALFGGQIKPTAGPSDNGKLNTCASDEINRTLREAGVKLSPTDQKLVVPALQQRAFEGRDR